MNTATRPRPTLQTLQIVTAALLALAAILLTPTAAHAAQQPDTLPAPAPGGLVTVPPVDGTVIASAPQTLTVPGFPTDQLVLTDQSGGVIVPTKRPDGTLGLPRLLPGQYELKAGDQIARFAIGGPSAQLAVIGWDFDAPPSAWPTYLLAGTLAGLAIVLAVVLARRRHLLWLAGLPLVAAIGVLGAGLWLTNATPAGAPLASCLATNQFQTEQETECGMRRLTSLLARDKFEQAVDELYGKGSCHDFGHEFARRAFVYTGNPDRLTAPNKSVCTEGFLHGVMYSGAMYLSDDEYRTFMDGFCEGITAEKGFSIGSCAHGVGHGWLMRTNGRLQDSQNECRATFDDNPPLRDECLGATIYEYIGTYTNAGGRPEWMPLDGPTPEQLCADTPDTDRLQLEWCYTSLATAHHWKTRPDREYAVNELRTCASLPGQTRQELCIRGVARTFPSALGSDPADAVVCRDGLPEGPLRETCGKSFAEYLANSTLDQSREGDVCAAIGLPAAACHNDMGKSWQDAADAAAANSS